MLLAHIREGSSRKWGALFLDKAQLNLGPLYGFGRLILDFGGLYLRKNIELMFLNYNLLRIKIDEKYQKSSTKIPVNCRCIFDGYVYFYHIIFKPGDW